MPYKLIYKRVLRISIMEDGVQIPGEWNHFPSVEEAIGFMTAEDFQGNRLLHGYSVSETAIFTYVEDSEHAV